MNKQRLQALVARFLSWPVPANVYPDGTPGKPGRTGTNLLSAPLAEEMLRHVLADESASATITKAQLQAALLQWETSHRNGETRSYEDTRALPLEQVVEESATYLWDLLAPDLAGNGG